MRFATLAFCFLALLLVGCDCADCTPPAQPEDGAPATEIQQDQPAPGGADSHPTQVGSGGGLGG